MPPLTCHHTYCQTFTLVPLTPPENFCNFNLNFFIFNFKLLDKFNIPMSDSEYRKLYRMVDPDGSGMVSYGEFQSEFGSSISGGSQCIRWGATALPKSFKVLG